MHQPPLLPAAAGRPPAAGDEPHLGPPGMVRPLCTAVDPARSAMLCRLRASPASHGAPASRDRGGDHRDAAGAQRAETSTLTGPSRGAQTGSRGSPDHRVMAQLTTRCMCRCRDTQTGRVWQGAPRVHLTDAEAAVRCTRGACNHARLPQPIRFDQARHSWPPSVRAQVQGHPDRQEGRFAPRGDEYREDYRDPAGAHSARSMDGHQRAGPKHQVALLLHEPCRPLNC